jgi:hypothetical protein
MSRREPAIYAPLQTKNGHSRRASPAPCQKIWAKHGYFYGIPGKKAMFVWRRCAAFGRYTLGSRAAPGVKASNAAQSSPQAEG